MDDALLERIKHTYERFNANEEFDLDLFHPDVEWHNDPGLPGGGVHHGIHAVLTDQAAQGEAWESRHVEVHEMIPAGDKVAVALTLHVVGKTSGVPVRIELVHLWTVADAKVRRVEVFLDRRAAMKAAGLDS